MTTTRRLETFSSTFPFKPFSLNPPGPSRIWTLRLLRPPLYRPLSKRFEAHQSCEKNLTSPSFPSRKSGFLFRNLIPLHSSWVGKNSAEFWVWLKLTKQRGKQKKRVITAGCVPNRPAQLLQPIRCGKIYHSITTLLSSGNNLNLWEITRDIIQ